MRIVKPRSAVGWNRHVVLSPLLFPFALYGDVHVHFPLLHFKRTHTYIYKYV